MANQPADNPTTRQEKLEALAILAAEAWDRWETLQADWKKIADSGKPMPSWPRDKFESYIDALTCDAKELASHD